MLVVSVPPPIATSVKGLEFLSPWRFHRIGRTAGTASAPKADNQSMTAKLQVSGHAKAAAETRGISVAEVADVVVERAPDFDSVAVFCGWAEGFRGASNGNEVWAIVREGYLRTIMFRRESQPATPEALRVRKVVK